MSDFANRIEAAYNDRRSLPAGKYSFFNPAYLYMTQMRDAKVLQILRERWNGKVADKQVLEVGCGRGGELLGLVRYGMDPRNISGVDILQDRVDAARNRLPTSNIVQGDGSAGLPWANGIFDMVMQFTVFTSILEPEVKSALAKEIIRVLKPGGFILWYDFHLDNPKNVDVKGVKLKEISGLFHGCIIKLEKTTLAPPITRLVAPCSTIACALLEKLRFLSTHYIGYIQKP